MKLKKKIIYATLSMLLAYIVFYRYLPPYTPLKSAQLISGLKIPRGVQFEKDESYFTFTGNGYTIFIISMTDKKFESFIRLNNWKKYNRLPMMREKSITLPDGYNYFFEKKPYDHEDGYYRVVVTGRSYEMAVVDCSQKKILVYAVYD